MRNTTFYKTALASAISALVLASSVIPTASAVTIDYRHEWVDVNRAHKDRILISDRLDNGIGYSVEAKAKSGGDDYDTAWSEMEESGTELSVSYNHKLTTAFSIQPAMNIEFGDDKAIYKPSLKFNYSFDNGFYTAFRYRYEYTRINVSNKEDEKCHRFEGWLGYKTGDWTFEGNAIWRESDQIRFNNKKNDYELDLKIAYAVSKNWKPYIQIGNVKVDSTTDDRQTRLRAGIQYIY